MTPRDLATRIERWPTLPDGDEERFAGYGVIGLPFSSGHYLALRRFPATSLGPAYSSVWWRDPAEHWSMFIDVPPTQGCPRYFGRALQRAETRAIRLTWTGPRTLHVSMPPLLKWDVELGSTPATTVTNLMAAALPRWAWRNPVVLRAMARLAGPLLADGQMRLVGSVPNGQSFRANPRRTWVITASRALIDGHDIGAPGPLRRQTRLGDLWLPQQGIFFIGESYIEVFDAARHSSETAAARDGWARAAPPALTQQEAAA